MEPSIRPKVSLDSLPTDVLSHVAFKIFSSDMPTARELGTLRSLSLSCRMVEQKLSLANNPHLYACIFHTMFDVGPIQRRMGSKAVVSSALALELKRRVEALRRINACLDGAEGEDRDSESSLNITHFIRFFLMMTENDGKNRRQVAELVNLSRIPDLLFLHASRAGLVPGEQARDLSLALIVAIMWIICNADTLMNEGPERRGIILDFLEPLALLPNTRSGTLGTLPGTSEYGSLMNMTYFGLRCRFSVPSLIPFARLCMVNRYNVANRFQRPGPDEPTILASKLSARFDEDWSRYLTVVPLLPEGRNVDPCTARAYTPGSFEGLWEGKWFLPCPIESTSTIFMAAHPVQCHLREYASFSAEDSVSFVEEDGDNGRVLARTWFPEGVEFDKTATSLRVWDPTKSRWLDYRPRSEIVHVSGGTVETQTVFDIILIGDTEAVYGATHGDYIYGGRVRREDGSVALVRQPADPNLDELGIWVFHGQVHGMKDFVGDWRPTSRVEHTFADKGWFHLSRVANDAILD